MIILILSLSYLLYLVYRVHQDRIAAQRAARRLRIARLRRHADEEGKLMDNGNMAGIYGEYPPSPEMRGVGIYVS